MKSYYVYVRTTDNQFFSCSIALCGDTIQEATDAAYDRFHAMGNPLPPASMIVTMRFVADPRNNQDSDGYEELCGSLEGEREALRKFREGVAARMPSDDGWPPITTRPQ